MRFIMHAYMKSFFSFLRYSLNKAWKFWWQDYPPSISVPLFAVSCDSTFKWNGRPLAPSTTEANIATRNVFGNISRRSLLTTLDSCLNKVKGKSIQNKTRDLANRQLRYNQTKFFTGVIHVFQRSSTINIRWFYFIFFLINRSQVILLECLSVSIHMLRS